MKLQASAKPLAAAILVLFAVGCRTYAPENYVEPTQINNTKLKPIFAVGTNDFESVLQTWRCSMDKESCKLDLAMARDMLMKDSKSYDYILQRSFSQPDGPSNAYLIISPSHLLISHNHVGYALIGLFAGIPLFVGAPGQISICRVTLEAAIVTAVDLQTRRKYEAIANEWAPNAMFWGFSQPNTDAAACSTAIATAVRSLKAQINQDHGLLSSQFR